jgi:putative radical SAM enzyme (TIGR03279 family)
MAAIVSSTRDARIPAGSRMISINQHLIEDFLDFRFHNDRQAARTVSIALDGSKKNIVFKPGEKIKIDIKEPQYCRCENDCAYCFVNGLPKGLRNELYFKDDDYRLSFLHGNFLSLTNVTDDDIKRISRLRLTPLYISVQSTDPALRQRLFANKKAGLVMEQLRALALNNIELHTQIVVVPGLNDKGIEKTVSDLARLHPAVRSIGIVPVGITKFNKYLRPVSKKGAQQIVKTCMSMQNRFRAYLGKGVVYLADEFFIKTGWRMPDSGYYDGYPQYENGIGMTRHFLDEIGQLKPNVLKKLQGKYLFLTGQLAARSLKWLGYQLERASPKIKITVLPVQNTLFGRSVTVSGLIGSMDFKRAISSHGQDYDKIFLPPNCVNRDGLFLDESVSNSFSYPHNLITSHPRSLSHPHTPLSPYPQFYSGKVTAAPYRVAELIKCLQ